VCVRPKEFTDRTFPAVFAEIGSSPKYSAEAAEEAKRFLAVFAPPAAASQADAAGSTSAVA
jgi:hypothetical protein